MSTFYKNGKTYMYCPQCGAEMEEKARFCIHCGYINYDNEDNNFMKKFARKIKKTRFNLRKDTSSDISTSNTRSNAVSLSTYKKGDKELKKTGLEIRYTIFKNLMRLIVLVLVIVGVYYGYSFIRDKQEKYVKDAEKIANYVKENINTCGKYYYYKFDEGLGLDVKSPYTKNGYKGYVLVVNENGNKKYYVSISDGTFGIREHKVDDLKYYNVLPYFGDKINEVSQTKC